MARMNLEEIVTKLEAAKARGQIWNVDFVEIKERLGILDSQYASLSRRVDRTGGDVEVIKRRLDIVSA